METQYVNEITRTYKQKGKVVAVAINETWKHDINNHVDSMTRYFCLDEVWEPDSSTFIVSSEKLQQLAGGDPVTQ